LRFRRRTKRSLGMRLSGCCRARLWRGRLVRGLRREGRARWTSGGASWSVVARESRWWSW
jgi:hypothetical protein